MHDVIEVVGKGSIIQHGKHNDRVYLMKLDNQDVEIIIDLIANLAVNNKYSKVFCKVPKNIAPLFFSNGYVLEAYIPRFYKSKDDVFFVSKFLDPDRLNNIENNQLSKLNQLLAEDYSLKKTVEHRAVGYTVRKLTNTDVEQMAHIYREIFISYPFPIYDTSYILKTMTENVQYFGVEYEGNLVALASSEVDAIGQNVEMTDFATLTKHGGKRLASILLNKMEKEMKQQGICTFYTIARLNSMAMNKTFLRAGYGYSGTLIKNTNIAGNIESMNVYFKHV